MVRSVPDDGSGFVPVPTEARGCQHEAVRTMVIVDDHDTFRATARQLLSAEGFIVVGEAADAASWAGGHRARQRSGTRPAKTAANRI